MTNCCSIDPIYCVCEKELALVRWCRRVARMQLHSKFTLLLGRMGFAKMQRPALVGHRTDQQEVMRC